MTFQKKIYLALSFWAVCTTVSVALCLFNLSNLIDSQKELDKINKISEGFEKVLVIILDMETGVRGYLLSGNDQYLEPFAASEGIFTEETDKLFKQIDKNSEAFKTLTKIVALKQNWIEGSVVAEMMARRKFGRGMIDFNAFVEIFRNSGGKKVTDEIRTLIRNQRTSLGKEVVSINSAVLSDVKSTIISLLAGILGVYIIGIASIVVLIKKTINHILQSLKNISNVSCEIASTSTSLTHSSNDLKNNVISTSTAATQVSASVEEIYMTTLKALDDLASSKTTITKSVSNVSDAQLSITENIKAANQIEVIKGELGEVVKSNTQSFEEIISLIKQIQIKTKVINEIVFQTKLLSFNASVEAARAGESGKGFSVVAEEVGNLAEMSGKSAVEINALLQESIAKVQVISESLTEKSEQSMRDFTNGVLNILNTSNSSSSCIEEINGSVIALQDTFTNVSLISHEQTKGLEQIKTAIAQVDSGAKENEVTSNTSNEMAVKLSKNVEDLENSLKSLNNVFTGS